MNFFETKIESFMVGFAYGDFTASGTSLTLGIPNESGGNSNLEYLVGLYGRVVTPFVGIAGPLILQIGDSTIADSIMFGVNLITAVQGQELPIHTKLSSPQIVSCENYPRAIHNPGIPWMTLTSSDGNLVDLTEGYFELAVVNLRKV